MAAYINTLQNEAFVSKWHVLDELVQTFSVSTCCELQEYLPVHLSYSENFPVSSMRF